MTEEPPTRKELLDQAHAVLEAVEESMYYPVAHGEAGRLQQMIEQYESHHGETDERR